MAKKTFACVTSMNRDYFVKCGQACIETYGAYWPKNIPLYVYNEDMISPPKNKWTRYVDWQQMPPQYHRFCERNQQWHRTLQFGKKAFSIIHAFETIECDRLIWLDADVMSTAPMNEHLLDLISPNSVLSTHFGVRHEWPSATDPTRTSFSCETGFFIVNKRHKQFPAFAERYLQYYDRDLGQNLRRYYDGEVYGAVVAEFESRGATMLELNSEQRHKTPIPRSVMAPYITHYKAGAKDTFDSNSLMKQHLATDDLSSDLS